MQRIETINNIEEYVKIISELSKQRRKDCIRDDALLFRGQANREFQLLPSIARTITNSNSSLLGYESDMISKAIGKNPEIFYEDKYGINLLVKLQHFGIPTRLLDVTYNSLVALYFACIDKDIAHDGEVFVFKITGDNGEYVQYYNDVSVNLISKTYKKKGQYPYKILNFLNDINIDITDCTNVEEYRKLFKNDISMFVERIKDPIFVSPVELSERQKRQQGAFIIFPNDIKKLENEDYFTACINPISKEDHKVIARITIPRRIKKELLDKLEFFGITEEFLFPDSTDIICKTIKKNALRRLGG